MTRVRIPGATTCAESSQSADLEFQDEGVSIGSASILDFVGDNVSAVKSGSKVTVTVSGSSTGGSAFRRADFTMTTLYPAAGTGSGTAGAILAGDTYRLIIGGSGDVTIGGVQHLNGQLIQAAIDTPGQTTANWDKIVT